MSFADELNKASLACTALSTIVRNSEAPYFQALAQALGSMALYTPGSGFVQVLTSQNPNLGTPNSLVLTRLATYTLPANTLKANGDALRIVTWGSLAAAAVGSTRRFDLKLGGQIIDGWNSTNQTDAFSQPWIKDTIVIRDGANSGHTAAKTRVSWDTNTAPNNWGDAADDRPITPDWSVAQDISVDGQNMVTPILNGLTCTGFIVELLKSS